MAGEGRTALRRDWTTGACAAAAARVAYTTLLTGRFPDPVSFRLPHGGSASFPLALAERDEARTRAATTKDAGGDPDVTQGALIIAETEWAPSGAGIGFAAGEGVGRVTRAGLLLAVRRAGDQSGAARDDPDMLIEAAAEHGVRAPDVTVTISIPGGERLAEKTMNARLGIIGGLSILGTTAIVIPLFLRFVEYIRSIAGLERIAALPALLPSAPCNAFTDLPDHALIDMGDFVGATLKYLRSHPVPCLTIAGGFAKLAKLAAGHLDLHSARSQVDTKALARMLAELGADAALVDAARSATGAGEILTLAADKREALARALAMQAREVALATISGETAIEVAIVDRQGDFLARVGG